MPSSRFGGLVRTADWRRSTSRMSRPCVERRQIVEILAAGALLGPTVSPAGGLALAHRGRTVRSCNGLTVRAQAGTRTKKSGGRQHTHRQTVAPWRLPDTTSFADETRRRRDRSQSTAGSLPAPPSSWVRPKTQPAELLVMEAVTICKHARGCREQGGDRSTEEEHHSFRGRCCQHGVCIFGRGAMECHPSRILAKRFLRRSSLPARGACPPPFCPLSPSTALPSVALNGSRQRDPLPYEDDCLVGATRRSATSTPTPRSTGGGSQREVFYRTAHGRKGDGRGGRGGWSSACRRPWHRLRGSAFDTIPQTVHLPSTAQVQGCVGPLPCQRPDAKENRQRRMSAPPPSPRSQFLVSHPQSDRGLAGGDPLAAKPSTSQSSLPGGRRHCAPPPPTCIRPSSLSQPDLWDLFLSSGREHRTGTSPAQHRMARLRNSSRHVSDYREFRTVKYNHAARICRPGQHP